MVRVVHAIHSLEPGGAEAVLAELGPAAAGAGLEIAVMPLVRIRDRTVADLLVAAEVPLLPLELAHRWDPRGFARADAALRRWRPDVVHTHLKHADLVGGIVARAHGIPWVSTLHIVDRGGGLVGQAKRRAATAARRRYAARTVTVSEAQRRWYLDAFKGADPDRVVTVHNGVADPRDEVGGAGDRSLRAELGLPDDVCLVLQLGLLRPGKGHHDLIEAVRRLGPEVRLHVAVAGDGELRAELEHAAADVADRITFLGFRMDAARLVRDADVLVQPSEFDALPTAVIQALAAGRPVVATSVGGIPEIVTPAEGTLLPPGSPPALARALEEMAGSLERRTALGTSARARYEHLFTVERMAARLHTLYDEVRDVRWAV